MKILIAIILSVLVLYAWAGVCYVYFRFARPETQANQQRFLASHYKCFTYRCLSPEPDEVTIKAIREAGKTGWYMIGIPIVNLSFGITYIDIILSFTVLFFGGLMFAQSWYGMRCFRMLKLDVYAKNAA